MATRESSALSSHDVWTAGETLGLLTTPESGRVASGVSLRLGFGGAESNFAIGVARLGLSVLWTSAMGDDLIGAMIARELEAEGVDVASRVDPKRRTGMMIKTPNAQGDRKVTYFRKDSAASAVSTEDLDPKAIASSRLVHLTGITPAVSLSARAFTREVIREAGALGVPVSFDLNYRVALWGPREASDFYREVLPYVNIVSGSPAEFALLFPEPNELKEIAEKVSHLGPQEVVVKNGARGAGVLDHGSWVECPAFPVEVIDAVGAGDAFMAGYISQKLTGSDTEQRLRAAAFAGAKCCAHYGDWEGNPILQGLHESSGQVSQ